MCCKIGCEQTAEWRIHDGPGPDDYTETCRSIAFTLLDSGYGKR
jgi:hypothetical protein